MMMHVRVCALDSMGAVYNIILSYLEEGVRLTDGVSDVHIFFGMMGSGRLRLADY